MSKEIFDLIRCLLEIDPTKRITAKEAIKFPIFDNINKIVD